MNEEAKQKIKKALKGVGLALGLLACFLLGLGAGYCSAQSGEPTTALTKTTPKRAMAQQIEVYNHTGYNLEDETEEFYLGTGTNYITPSIYWASQGDTYIFHLPEGISGYLYATYEDDGEIYPAPTLEIDYNLVYSGITTLDIYLLDNAGQTTIHNDKPRGQGILTIINQDFTQYAIQEGESRTFDRATLAEGGFVLNTDSVLCNFGTTANGSELGTGRNLNLTWQNLPLDLYVSYDGFYFTLKNQTTQLLNYAFENLTSKLPNDEVTSYLVQQLTQVIETRNTGQMTIWGNYPFTMTLGAVTATAQMEVENGHYLSYKYYVIVDLTRVEDESTIQLNNYGGEVDTTLTGTFSLMFEAVKAWVPILELKVFGEITLGVILALPLTIFLIVLLFKMLKQ